MLSVPACLDLRVAAERLGVFRSNLVSCFMHSVSFHKQNLGSALTVTSSGALVLTLRLKATHTKDAISTCLASPQFQEIASLRFFVFQNRHTDVCFLSCSCKRNEGRSNPPKTCTQSSPFALLQTFKRLPGVVKFWQKKKENAGFPSAEEEVSHLTRKEKKRTFEQPCNGDHRH